MITVAERPVCVLLWMMAIFGWMSGSHGCPTSCNCDEQGSVTCSNVDVFPDPGDIPDGTLELQMRNCRINKIGNLPDYGPDLENLIIVNSGVMEIADGAFSALTGLKNLMLNENKLTAIKASQFTGLKNLVKLELGNNLITLLPNGVLSTLPSLLRLDLSSNRNLRFEQDAFEGSKIVDMALSHCNITMVDLEVLSKASNLVEVNLDHNMLGPKLHEDSFKGMGNLQTLYLADCGLEEVDKDAFDDLENLQFLDLSYNRLHELDEDILNDIENTLKTLKLNHNELSTLDHDFGVVESLSVGDNPWECSCASGIGWMVEITPQTDDNATCYTPVEVRGHTVVNATSQLDCLCGHGDCEEKSIMGLYIAIPVVIICVLLICFFVYKIVKNRREKARKKSVKYSAVYKDTVESAQKPV